MNYRGTLAMADTDHPLKRLIALAAADFAVWLLIANGECRMENAE
jgi:hypothetical protein